MAMQHGGDLYDFGSMTDEEVRSVVVEQLRENSTIDADEIDVQVQDGLVTLTGRVGTDGEVQVAEQIVHDVLGIESYLNDLVVDELQRGTLSEAADEAIEEADRIDQVVGDERTQQTDTADHLVENLEEETFGTNDMSTAIRHGTSYAPPDGPRPEGYDSTEDH